jgi:hypothetical protein
MRYGLMVLMLLVFPCFAGDLMQQSTVPTISVGGGSSSGVDLSRNSCTFHGNSASYNAMRSQGKIPAATSYIGGGSACPAGTYLAGLFSEQWARYPECTTKSCERNGPSLQYYWTGASVLCCN